MLPNIVDIAEQHGLIVEASSRFRKEVKCKCPFCHEDSKPNKQRKYYLSLNSKDQVFKCWFCGEKGGVFRFISLLEHVDQKDIVQRYQKRNIIHPAEQLNRNQRHLLRQSLGGGSDPDWRRMRERDMAYYKRSLEWLWAEWNAFKEREKQQAYFWLLLGIKTRKYEKYVEHIRQREKQIEVPLLQYVCTMYSLAERPTWTNEVEQSVDRMLTEIQMSEMNELRLKGG